MAAIKKIIPNLWFDTEAEDAANFYTTVFKRSSINRVSYYSEAGKEIHKKEPGSVMSVEFTLNGQQFLALNGGPDFKFNESVSFAISCANQKEVDYFWEKLGEEGDPAAQQCGWLKDKYGLSWQIVPVALARLLQDEDRDKVERVTAAMMNMKKLDVKELERAGEMESVPA